MNDKFFNLTEKKQLNIINGALEVFGKYDYKKASMEEIAKCSGISKSLLFHYFETKKELYLYLYKYGINIMMQKLEEADLKNETDFFTLMRKSIIAKANVLEIYPSLTNFLIQAYYETNAELSTGIAEINNQITQINIGLYFKSLDMSLFKDDIPFEMALNTFVWVSDGYMNSKKNTKIIAKDIVEEFDKYIDLFRKLFYKEGK